MNIDKDVRITMGALLDDGASLIYELFAGDVTKHFSTEQRFEMADCLTTMLAVSYIRATSMQEIPGFGDKAREDLYMEIKDQLRTRLAINALMNLAKGKP